VPQYRREDRFERIKSQVISTRETAEVALELIRNEGVEAVTIRRLAFELDVKSASLYYHFRNKEEILAMAAKVALEGIRGAGDPRRPWREWLLENTVRYRRALLVYPDLVPTLMSRHPLHIGTEEHEQAVQLLERQGVPAEIVMPLFDALESLACGSALYAAAAANHDRAEAWKDEFPALYRVSTRVGMTDDEAFERAARGVIDGLAGSA
jgi:AcrR family transcriptional regulator